MDLSLWLRRPSLFELEAACSTTEGEHSLPRKLAEKGFQLTSEAMRNRISFPVRGTIFLLVGNKIGAHGTIEVATSTGTALAGNASATWKTVPSGITYDLNNVRCMAIGCVAAGVGHLVLITPPATTSGSWKVRPIS